MNPSSDKPVIGWREWVTLSDFGAQPIKAKVDTGARTSSLHAYDIEVFHRRGKEMARFKVHPLQRDGRKVMVCEAQLLEHRWVRSSSGAREHRPVITTMATLMGQPWPIELTLTNRDVMGFRMLLGREATRSRFLVDPGRSFLTTGVSPKKPGKKTSRRAHDRQEQL